MTRLKPCCVAVLLHLACVSLLLVGSGVTLLHAQARDDLTIIELVRCYGPSVVAVHLTVEDERVQPGIGGAEPQQLQGGGSGFVVEEQGHIVTNFHVVFAALADLEAGGIRMREDTSIAVSFLELPEREFPVRVVGANPDFDLALLALEQGEQLPNVPPLPRLGLSGALNVEDYPPPLQQQLDLPDHGVIVMEVSPGGPADRAGLEGPTGVVVFQGRPFPVGGHIVTAADGRPVERFIDLQQVVLEREAGETVALTVWREGSEQQMEVVLKVVPTEQGACAVDTFRRRQPSHTAP